jgi:hypothetical protein
MLQREGTMSVCSRFKERCFSANGDRVDVDLGGAEGEEQGVVAAYDVTPSVFKQSSVNMFLHCARSDAIASRLTPTGTGVGHKSCEQHKTNVGVSLLAMTVAHPASI